VRERLLISLLYFTSPSVVVSHRGPVLPHLYTSGTARPCHRH